MGKVKEAVCVCLEPRQWAHKRHVVHAFFTQTHENGTLWCVIILV